MLRRRRPSLVRKSKPSRNPRRRLQLIEQKRKRHRRQRSDFMLIAQAA
ncbi:hypothetical protein [Aeromonas simiae]|nr:hypothetical protein [Aeromonas simiae]MDO2947367.1 hypothetical protein [Aeromonas simiae]MDO2951089.1 hypothetical protein [Aeromonas simiae]MDO2954677.1 hypothetical protein [Aeromonas simiae]